MREREREILFDADHEGTRKNDCCQLSTPKLFFPKMKECFIRNWK
jgi:hypothetical protein